MSSIQSHSSTSFRQFTFPAPAPPPHATMHRAASSASLPTAATTVTIGSGRPATTAGGAPTAGGTGSQRVRQPMHTVPSSDSIKRAASSIETQAHTRTSPPAPVTAHTPSHYHTSTIPDIDLAAVNARVESRFNYWKQFWSHSHFGEEKEQLNDRNEVDSDPTGDDYQYTDGVKARREEVENLLRKMRERRDTQPNIDITHIDSHTRCYRTPVKEEVKKSSPSQSSQQQQQQQQSASPQSQSPPSSHPTTPSSNIARFWQEEAARKPHLYSDSKDLRRRKHLGQLSLPNDPEQAREMWERMKADMWKHWEAKQKHNQTDESRPKSPPSAKSTANSESQSPPQPSSSNRGQPPTKSKSAASAARPTPSPHHSATPSKPFNIPLTPNRPKTPAANARSCYHPPSAASFTPPSSSSTSYSFRGAQTPKSAPSATSFSFTPSPASSPSQSQSQAVSPYASHTVKQLLALLSAVGLTSADCLEKQDMIDKLERHQKQQQQLLQNEERLRERMLSEIVDWARNKSIQQLLNDLHQSPSLMLTSSSSYSEVSRVYKKTLLLIHPDKVPIDDTWQKFRATEIFKVVNSKFREFKEVAERQSSEAKI